MICCGMECARVGALQNMCKKIVAATPNVEIHVQSPDADWGNVESLVCHKLSSSRMSIQDSALGRKWVSFWPAWKEHLKSENAILVNLPFIL